VRKSSFAQQDRSHSQRQFPLIRQPCRQVVDSCRRQLDQQLGKLQLQVHVVATAGAGQAGQDRCRATPRALRHLDRGIGGIPSCARGSVAFRRASLFMRCSGDDSIDDLSDHRERIRLRDTRAERLSALAVPWIV
jgi:hypothetical protein